MIAWEERKELSEGLRAVKLDGLWGYADEKWEKVIAPKYQNAEKFSEGMAAVCKGGKWGFIDKAGKMVIKNQFDYAYIFKDGFAIVAKKGMKGVIDQTGKVVIPFEYEIIEDGKKYFAVAKNGKRGILDFSGKEVTPLLYDWIQSGEETTVFEKDRRYGLLSAKGEEITKPTYDFIGRFYSGLAYCEKDKKHGFLNEKGEEVIAPQFSEVKDFRRFFGGYAAEVDFTFAKKDEKWGVIDLAGNVLFSFDLDGYDEDFAEKVMLGKKDGKSFLVDMNSWKILSKKYDRIEKPQKNGLCVVRDGDNWLAGIIDLKGEEVVEPAYDQIFKYNDGLARFCIKEHYGFLDEDGKQRFVIQNIEEVRDFSDGMAAFRRGKLWGFVDINGEEVIKPQFSSVGDFSEGFVSFSRDRGAGYIDKTGKQICDDIYSVARPFKGGYAVVAMGSSLDPVMGLIYGAIDKNGNRILPLAYKKVGDFKNGCFKVKVEKYELFVNEKKERVVAPLFASEARHG